MPDPSTDTTQSTDGSTLKGILSGSDVKDMLRQSQASGAAGAAAATAFPGEVAKIKQETAIKERPLNEQLQTLSDAAVANMKEKPPEPHTTSLVEEWGSPAMLLAVFASAFTRQPLMNALNAGGAVMKAYQQRDFDAAQTAYKQWEHANDSALKLTNMQIGMIEKALKEVHQASKDEIGEKKAEVQLMLGPGAMNIPALRAMAVAGEFGRIGIATEDMKLKAADMADKADRLKKEKEAADAMHTARQDRASAAARNDSEGIAKADAQIADLTQQAKDRALQRTGKVPGSDTKADKFGTMDDLMSRWHQDFVAKQHREPTTDEIAAQRQALQGQIKPTGGRTQQMTQRLMIGANEVNKAVQALTKMPAGTTLGWFGGAQAAQGEGLAENVKKALANEVTPQSSQVLKALSNGVSRGLAILESGGSAQGLVGLSKQLQNDLPQQNDTGLTIAAKFADIRQIVEAATEVLETSELSKDQKVLIKNIAENIQKAVPFTTSDVAEMAANPTDETIAQFAHRIGLGKPPGPKIDEVHDGYRFKGGDPADHHNWEKTQ